MRKRLVGALATSAFASALLVASASAATEVGSDCEASGMVVGATLFPLTVNSTNSLPINTPISGVATKWKVRSPGSDVHTEKLMVLRPAFASNQVQVIAESSLEGVTEGRETFDIRIPVQAGDRFGVSGKFGEGAIACIPGRPGDVSGIFFGESHPGQTQTFSEDNGFQAAVSAVVEPDADRDGYGDETQDGCPASATTHDACPAPMMLSVKAKVRKHSILLQVTPSSNGSVDVYGQVGWNFRPKPEKDRARPSKKGIKRLIVALDGGTEDVTRGTTSRFTIHLPKPVKLRLGRLTRRESIRAKLTLRATNPAGITKNTRLRVTLRGWRPLH